MRTTQQQTIRTDVLIVGSGIAGLRAAIEAAQSKASVLVVSGSRTGQACNSVISGGGFACTYDAAGETNGDSPEKHFEDTITSGQALSDPALVRLMVEGIRDQKEFLQSIGLMLADPAWHTWITTLTGTGHTYPRMNYIADLSGVRLMKTLEECARKSGAEFLEGVLITRLIVEDGRAVGALGLDRQGTIVVFSAGSIILATGGLGSLYQRNDNAKDTAGYGYSLAYEAGACLQDMEFTQFDPLGLGQGRTALFFESLLIHPNIKLLNKNGEDVLRRFVRQDDIQLTRDVLTALMVNEIRDGLGVEDKLVLDVSELPSRDMEDLAPQLPRSVSRGSRRFLVSPTCHFHMGGVKVNPKCETTVKGLYGAGEVCAGVHGANRLPGNAISEALVFGRIAGWEAAIAAARSFNVPRMSHDLVESEIAGMMEQLNRIPDEGIPTAWRELQTVMWRHGGPGKEEQHLEDGLNRIGEIKDRYAPARVVEGGGSRDAFRLWCGLLLAEMMLRAGKSRRESRGTHYRLDIPWRDDRNWLCNISIREDNGQMSLRKEEVFNPD